MSEHDDLNRLLNEEADRLVDWGSVPASIPPEEYPHTVAVGRAVPANEEVAEKRCYVQWTSSDDATFFPASHTRDGLIPGVYEICHSQSSGIFFKKIPVRTEGLLEFPQANSHKVIDEIKKFWDREDIFRNYNLNYKRGILLYGPPGSGKSCTIQFLMKDVVSRDGVVLLFKSPSIYIEGLRILREIQPDTPIVTIMEDIDSLISVHCESEILNILDGVNEADKVVFLATTNYPEKLGARIVNRPSRFDKRFRIGYPNEESRRMYFKHLIGQEKINDLDIDLNRWVEDSDKFSLAHLKELFVAVVILGDDYDEAVKVLKSMKEHIDDDEVDQMGFGVSNRRKTRGGDDFYA